MKRGCLAIMLLILAVTSPLACRAAAADWPERVQQSLWISSGAYEIVRRSSQGVYSVSYKLDLCQPAHSFLAGMVKQMKSLGWKRLEFDPYNAGLKQNHAKEPGGLWDHYYYRPEKYYVLQWIDDWEDSKKNVVRYGLRYRAADNDFQHACTLEVSVGYFPVEMMRDMRVDK